MLKVILFILQINCATAAIPTVEGLFRNPSNPDLDGDMIVIRASIEQLRTGPLKDNSDNEGEEETFEKGHYKFIFQKKLDSKKVHLLQVSYKSAEMSDKALVGAEYFADFNKDFREEELLKSLFYSFITMYGLNSSTGMSDVLSRYGSNYVNNTKLMNKEKMDLMKKYKQYLARIKGDKEKKLEIQSPMKPEAEEDILKVKKILTQNMYNSSTSVTLQRKSGRFYWQVQLENIFALFSNISHNLLFFEVKDKELSVKTYFRDYILFDGKHQLPKTIEMQLSDGRTYQIRIYKFRNFQNKTKTMVERFNEYKEKLEEVNKDQLLKEDVFKKPILII